MASVFNDIVKNTGKTGWTMLSLVISFIPGFALAATINQGDLLSNVSADSTNKTITASAGDHLFTQAADATGPGFSLIQADNQVIYSNSQSGQSSSATTVQSLVFNGDPIELGIPGELGSLTINAGNSIDDFATDRTYSRPVVFTQLVGNYPAGAAIVPTMPLMEGNTFSFTVEIASGESVDLEGATVNYFIAEEGWHRLADGRLLLISSIELRDEDYAGLSFELGASFTNAVTITQLQRPALIINNDGSVTPKTGYQGVMLSGGQGDFNSLTMRFMADAAYEAEASVRNFGARIGFMVLGEATVRDDWPMAYHQYYSSVHADAVVGEGYFKNFRHSAAASPLFNKIACADDADLDGYCFFMSPPADMPSRQSKFDLPRLPYVDEKFQPLTLNLNKHGSSYNYDWWWDIGESHLLDAASEGVIESAAENPNNLKKFQLGECSDADNCPVNGALSQGLPKLDSDRWFDLYGFANTRMEYGHWYNVRNYDGCVQDGVNSACVDLGMEDLLGAPNIDWDAQSRLIKSYVARRDDRSIFGEAISELSSEQAVFSDLDASLVDSYEGIDILTPDVNAANNLANYLNFDVPEEIRWLGCNVSLPFSGWPSAMDVFPRLQQYANLYAKELKLDPWQVMGTKLWVRASETKALDGYTYSDSYSYGMYIPIPANDDTWQGVFEDSPLHCAAAVNGRLSDGVARNWEYDYVPTYKHVIKPVIDKLGNYVAPGVGGVFANYPFSGNETNLRWVRSSNQSLANATTVASGQAGYVATADDENSYLSFCLDNSDGETACADDWVRVKATPYITFLQFSPINAYAFIGNDLSVYWSTKSPSGDPVSATQTWWVVGNKIDTDATPHPSISSGLIYSTAGMSPSWVQFCVQPATEYVTGETVCSDKVFVDHDSDGDLIKDSVDLDDDNDNTSDAWDRFPLDPNEAYDHDNDGIGDNADTDDDNDGLPDSEEGANNLADYQYCPDDLSTVTNPFNRDSDGDGLLDGEDPHPCFAGDWLDVDNDGIHDNEDTDNDNDGVDDVNDAKRLEACLSDEITVTNDNDSGPGSLRQALSDLCPHKLGSPLSNGTISFAGPYTIRLQSPLQLYGGVTIDGNHEVTISGDSDGNGIPDVALFDYDLPSYLPQTQNLQLRNIALTHAKATNGHGSVVTTTGHRPAFFDGALLAYNEGPAVLTILSQVYLENTIVAHGTGSVAAIMNKGGYVGIFSSTFINNLGGALDGDTLEEYGQVSNSLLLRGESGSAACNIINERGDGNWFEEGGLCGEASSGSVTLADAANGDYRPIPGSSSIDVGVEMEGTSVDYAGNARIQNDVPDAGALEYDPTGDFDGDGVTDSDDAFPVDKNESADSDGDGVGDNADAFPNDATKTTTSDSAPKDSSTTDNSTSGSTSGGGSTGILSLLSLTLIRLMRRR